MQANCPDCGRPLREVFIREGQPRRFMCDIAVKGLLLGKTGEGYVHKEALIYIEKR